MNDSVCKYIYNCGYFDIVIAGAMLKVRLKIKNIRNVVFWCFVFFDFKYYVVLSVGFCSWGRVDSCNIRILCSMPHKVLKIRVLTGGGRLVKNC